MRVILSTVLDASVTIEGRTVGQIGRGYLLLVGFTDGDDKETVSKMVDKILSLRVFPDEHGMINISLQDVKGGILSVSQFTLYAECKKSGNRPSFTDAAKPDIAIPLYEYFVNECKKQVPIVQTGIFGADMKVNLLNDGPVTLILNS